MQSTITLKSYKSDSGTGADTFTSSSLRAVVDKKQQQVRAFDGTMKMSSTVITILDPSVVVGENDIVVLADGSGGPVLGVGGFIDGETSRQALVEVYLG